LAFAIVKPGIESTISIAGPMNLCEPGQIRNQNYHSVLELRDAEGECFDPAAGHQKQMHSIDVTYAATAALWFSSIVNECVPAHQCSKTEEEFP
jgi:hypothetical protein